MNRENPYHPPSQPSVFLPVTFSQVICNCVSVPKLSLVTLCHSRQEECGQPQASCSLELKRRELTKMQNKPSKKLLTPVCIICRLQNGPLNHYNQKVVLGQIIHVLVYPCFVLNPKFPLSGFTCIAKNVMSYLQYFFYKHFCSSHITHCLKNLMFTLPLLLAQPNMLFYIPVLT